MPTSFLCAYSAGVSKNQCLLGMLIIICKITYPSEIYNDACCASVSSVSVQSSIVVMNSRLYKAKHSN